MPAVRCPHCQHEMQLHGARPGRFYPACPQCKRKFGLIVPADASQSPQVMLEPPEVLQTRIDAVLDATAAKTPPLKTQPARQPSMQPPMQPPTATVPPSRVASSAPDKFNRTTPPSSARQAGPAPQPRDWDTDQDGRSADDFAEASDEPRGDLSGKLGGYELKQKLGQGGMGQVYLARQLSLDRNVAIKILSPALAADAEFVARFTREAYAAAQLSHHHVVQIHDIGIERRREGDIHYFSMEFVDGQSLGGLVKQAGKLDAEVAAGYVLQAARGLKEAHAHGLVHRDIKPDNLLLNDQGVVKVADLGLVKKVGATEAALAAMNRNPRGGDAALFQTQLSISMGTPAFMPPEQAYNAAAADARSDIYSLGCTFYDLLTGHPPFVGGSAAEVMTKHATVAAIPPDRAAKHVPPKLSNMVLRMMAKRPEDRPQTMDEVIGRLEAWLGVESGKPFSPAETHVHTLEQAVQAFNTASIAKVRSGMLWAFFVLVFAATVVCAMPTVGRPKLSIASAATGLATILIYQFFIGLFRRSPVARKSRQLLFDVRLEEWLKIVGVLLLAAVLTVLFGATWLLLGSVLVGAATAMIFYAAIDLPLKQKREQPLRETEAMLKELRLRGLEEQALRQFVAVYAGDHWEAFYESLFGYDDKRIARIKWGRAERSRNRPRFAAWRDPLIDWIDRKLASRKAERERRVLARLETKALAKAGIEQATAEKQAQRAASRMVKEAAAVRAADTQLARSAETAPPARRPAAAIFDASLADTLEAEPSEASAANRKAEESEEEEREHLSYFARRYGSPIDLVLGRFVRFVIGAVLITGFAMWWNQNSGADARRSALSLLSSREEVTIDAKTKQVPSAVQVFHEFDERQQASIPLKVSGVPQSILDAIGNWNGGVAGALLILSALCTGRLLGVLSLLAAGACLVGDELPVPFIQGHPAIAMIAGIVLTLGSMLLVRDTARS